MPDNIPNLPGGALPPKPAEAAKVQPKKETVRINLPPKPTSAPTIKLPALAPGAPMPTSTSAAAPVAAHAAAAPRAAAVPAPPPSAAPAAHAVPAPQPSRAGGPPAARPPGPAVGSRPAPMGGGFRLGTLDLSLAIAAAVFGLAAVGTSVYLAFFIPGVSLN